MSESGTYRLEFNDLNGFYQDYIENNVQVNSATPVGFDMNFHVYNALSVQTFYDSNYEAGLIAGNLNWIRSSTVSVSYNVYYLTNSNEVIGSPITVSETTYSISNNVPYGAKRLGVRIVSPTSALGPMVSTPLWDNGACMPNSFSLYDTNDAPDAIDLQFNWKKPLDESQISRYLFSYRDSLNQSIGNTQEVAVSAVTNYVYIPNITVANTVYTVDVRVKTIYDELAPFIYSFKVSDQTSGKTTFTASPNANLNTPLSAHFYDTDPIMNSIGGTINWEETSVTTGITSYEVYYLDANNIKIGSVLTVSKLSWFHNHYQAFIQNGSPLIVGGTKASKLGIYPKDVNGAEGTPKIIELNDRIGGVPQSVFFFDYDLILSHVTGTLSWYSAMDESATTAYKVYFADEQDNLIEPAIGVFSKAMEIA